MNSVIAITAILVNEFNEILIYLRDDGNGTKIKYPNQWSFLGGTVEGDESVTDCLIREMKEELELELKPEECKEFQVYHHDGGEDHVFLCRIKKETPLQLHEGREKAWAPLSLVAQHQLAWHQNDILEQVASAIEGL